MDPLQLIENHFFLAGQFIVNALDDNIQMLALMDEIEIICFDGQHRAIIKGINPIVIVGFKQGQVFCTNA